MEERKMEKSRKQKLIKFTAKYSLPIGLGIMAVASLGLSLLK